LPHARARLLLLLLLLLLLARAQREPLVFRGASRRLDTQVKNTLQPHSSSSRRN
jgi:hypothetical protein